MLRITSVRTMNMYSVLLVIVFPYVWGYNSTSEISADTNPPTNLKEFEAKIMNLMNSITKKVTPMVLRVVIESGVSMPCSMSLLRFSQDIKKMKEWALKMLDANGKFPASFLEGTSLLLGGYDDCLDIVVMNEKQKKVSFEGQYCMANIKLPEFFWQQLRKLKTAGPLPAFWKPIEETIGFGESVIVHLGLCVPSTCTASDVNKVVRRVTRSFGLITNVTCETKTKREPNTEQIVFMCVFSVFIILVIVGTGLDLITNHIRIQMKPGELYKFVKAFSLYSNIIHLFRTVQHDNVLLPLRGCRLLSLFWVILAHIYYYTTEFHLLKYRRIQALKDFSETLMFHIIMKITVALDTFFLISATLFVYTTWRKLEENKGWFNPFTYILIRMARILLIEMPIVALSMLLPLFGNGPIWNAHFKEIYAACRDNWWKNLLFIQNYEASPNHLCLTHTWFIGVLIQLLILASGIPMILYRWPKLGISINVLLILIGCFLTGFLTSFYNLISDFSQITGFSVFNNYMEIIHLRPYTYFPSYFFGILLGYAIVKKRHTKIKPLVLTTAWLFAICGVIIVIFGSHFLDLNRYELLNATYAALYRLVWTFSVSWMLFACVTGYGGFIGKILSWKVMTVLDRLSLLMYLLHPLVISQYTANTRGTIYLDHTQQVFIYLATIVLTLIASVILNASLEQPLRYIESFFMRKFSKNRLSDDITPKTAAVGKSYLLSVSEMMTTSLEPVLNGNKSSRM